MDPNAALIAILEGDEDAIDHVEALRAWVVNYGFPPYVELPLDCSPAFQMLPRGQLITADRQGIKVMGSVTRLIRWGEVIEWLNAAVNGDFEDPHLIPWSEVEVYDIDSGKRASPAATIALLLEYRTTGTMANAGVVVADVERWAMTPAHLDRLNEDGPLVEDINWAGFPGWECRYWQEESFREADRQFDGGEWSDALQGPPEYEACGKCSTCVASDEDCIDPSEVS